MNVMTLFEQLGDYGEDEDEVFVVTPDGARYPITMLADDDGTVLIVTAEAV